MQRYSEFGAEVRKVMLLKGLTIREIAKKLGVSSTYVHEILKGTRPGGEYKRKIAEIIGVELEAIS